MDSAKGTAEFVLKGEAEYILRISKGDVKRNLVDYVKLLDDVAVIDAGDNVDICHLTSSQLVECLRTPLYSLEIYMSPLNGERDYSFLYGRTATEKWFTE